MLTCSSSRGISTAFLRQHSSIISSSRTSSLLLFSLMPCVHKKLTTFQQCFLSTGAISETSSDSRKCRHQIPRQKHRCCSLNLNNHHITFHYINSSIVTSTTATPNHQPRCFIHHQSSSAPSLPSTKGNGSKFITYSNLNTNDNGLKLRERLVSKEEWDQVEEQNDVDKLAAEEMLKDQVWSKGPALTPTFNVGAYANDSENVKKLLNLGVDLSKWETRYGAIPLLYKSNYESTMEPIIQFLMDLQLEESDLQHVLTINPFIFKEHVSNLKKRVEYLKAKKFEDSIILKIITRNPYWLSFSVPRIDRRLGFFQTYFGLTGNQVRTLASVGSSGPKLITYHLGRVKDVTFTIKEEMGFTSEEIVKLLLKQPRLWREVPTTLRRRFDYLHNEEKFSHIDFLRSPMLLRTRERRMRERIGILKKLSRAQFDPRLPHYISSEKLCTGNDEEWATDVARVSVTEYNNYLKTL